MGMHPPGVLRPRQERPLTATEEARLARVCPGLGQRVEPDGHAADPLWGAYLQMRTGHAADPSLRFAGSSGGGLSQILAWLLETGRIDAAITNAADTRDPLANVTVSLDDPADVVSTAGSRYAPSAPLAGLAAHLDSGRTFAFVGKPCDIVALRALAADDARIDRQIPYKLSFFCAGVPSLDGAEAVLSALGTTRAATRAFRYRGHGWPGAATALDHDGRTRQMSYQDSWGGILSRHVQHRCKICADGTGVAADLVCADAWECDEKGYPVFDERDGISLFVARTEAGMALMQGAEQAGRITTQPFDPARLAAIQPGQRNRRRALLARLLGLRAALRPVPDYRGLTLRAAARQNSLRTNVTNFLGSFRRGLKMR